MATISLKTMPYPKFQNETFIHIEPFQRLYEGKIYRFLQFPDLHFIRQVLCVNVQFLPLGDISDSLSFLDKDCDKEIYFKCMALKKIPKTAAVYVGTFTNSGNSKKHYNAPIHN